MRNGHKIVLEWATETGKAIETFKRNVELQAAMWDKVEKFVTKLETEAERENDGKMV